MLLVENGTGTSTNSVTDISKYGFWVLYQNEEYFIPFSDYPAFKKHPIDEIFNVEFIGSDQLYWPNLDIDIEISALKNPEHFPLLFS